MTYFDSIIGQDSIKAHLSEFVSRNALLIVSCFMANLVLAS
mgnify:FL=1